MKGLLGLVSEIVKLEGQAGNNIITDLINQIIVERIIPADWEVITIEICYKRRGDALEETIGY